MSEGKDRPSVSDLALFARVLREARLYWLHIFGLLILAALAAPLSLLGPVPLKIAVDSVLGTDPRPGFLQPLVPASLRASSEGLLGFAAALLVVLALAGQLRSLAHSLLRSYTGEKLRLAFRSKFSAMASGSPWRTTIGRVPPIRSTASSPLPSAVAVLALRVEKRPQSPSCTGSRGSTGRARRSSRNGPCTRRPAASASCTSESSLGCRYPASAFTASSRSPRADTHGSFSRTRWARPSHGKIRASPRRRAHGSGGFIARPARSPTCASSPPWTSATINRSCGRAPGGSWTIFPNPALSPDDREVLQRTLASFEILESCWPELEAVWTSAGATLVHGDFGVKIMRLRGGGGAPELLVFDWECAGRGAPADEMFEVDPAAYVSAVRAAGGDVSLEDAEVWKDVGGPCASSTPSTGLRPGLSIRGSSGRCGK